MVLAARGSLMQWSMFRTVRRSAVLAEGLGAVTLDGLCCIRSAESSWHYFTMVQKIRVKKSLAATS